MPLEDCPTGIRGAAGSDQLRPSDQGVLHCAVFSLEPHDHACALLRVVQPFEWLTGRVDYIWCGTEGVPEADLAALARADLVLVQRFFPCRENRKALDAILRSGKPVLYETDDLLDDLPPGHYLAAHSLENRTILREFVRRCDTVVVSTEPLAQAYRAFNSRIRVVPNHLDPTHWFGAPPKEPHSGHDREPLVIGFFGTGSHRPDLALVEEPLAQLAEKHQGKLEFRFLGCITPALAALPNSTYGEHWCSYDRFPAAVGCEGIDIGIAPLVDSPLNRCKSDLKWLEYSALGIPGVYSAVAPYLASVQNGITGLVVDNTPAAWFAALDGLVTSASLRQQIAQTARAEVRKDRTLETGASMFLDALRDTAAQQPDACRVDRTWELVMAYEDALATQGARLSQAESALAWIENSLPYRLLKRLRNLF